MADQTNQAKKHTLDDLELLYNEGNECDKEVFAEMRSNLLLISGEHYQKRNANFFRRVKDSKDLSDTAKLRLTKNHIQKITKTYCNNIVSVVPGVVVGPKNDDELSDQKSAQMNQAIWADLKDRHNFREMVDEWVDDFVGIGEVSTKIFFDKTLGDIVAYKQKVDDAGANLYLDPTTGEETSEAASMDGTPHQPAPGEPVYSGDFVFEPIFGFNLLRSPDCKDLRKSPHLIVRKMVDVKDLQARFPKHADKIKSSMDETMVVFDANKGDYGKAKNQTMLKEIYFRPCPQYPKGYFFFWVKGAVLAEDELPAGKFPIKTQLFERVQTSPRGRSPVKIMRPYQIEINRSASKMAEHQVTLGDDKLLIQNGTTLSSGNALPGVRAVNYTGMPPGILNGRDGSQYLNYMQAQITELYDVMMVSEQNAQKPDGTIDPFAMLFRAASEKKRFSRYVRRFENFLQEICKLALDLSKVYLSDDAVVYAVGKKERVNIPEFRQTVDNSHVIKIEPQAEDIESKLGKQMVLNHALQYVGNKLEKEDIGKIMRAMPYGNFEESFGDMTQEYDCGTNMILALDRGERPLLSQYDNYVYLIKRLVARMRQADFKYLPQEAQNNYNEIVDTMQDLEAQRQAAIQAAKDGFIPTGGYLVTVQLYVSDPSNPLKTRLARIPYDSVAWLIQKLEAQGASLDQIEKMNEGVQAQFAQRLLKAGSSPNGMGGASQPGPEAPGVENVPQHHNVVSIN